MYDGYSNREIPVTLKLTPAIFGMGSGGWEVQRLDGYLYGPGGGGGSYVRRREGEQSF